MSLFAESASAGRQKPGLSGGCVGDMTGPPAAGLGRATLCLWDDKNLLRSLTTGAANEPSWSFTVSGAKHGKYTWTWHADSKIMTDRQLFKNFGDISRRFVDSSTDKRVFRAGDHRAPHTILAIHNQRVSSWSATITQHNLSWHAESQRLPEKLHSHHKIHKNLIFKGSTSKASN